MDILLVTDPTLSMATTHSVWIPSQQQYIGFGKFTTAQQLQLAQSVELNQTNTTLDFERNLADVISNLSAGVIDGKDINAYDKVAIVLQLAIMHVGDINKVHHRCPTCTNADGGPIVTTIKYGLSDILQRLQPVIDVNPQQMITSGDFSGVMINLDIVPTGNLLTLLQFQAQLHDTENVAMLSWIRSMVIGNTMLDFRSFTYCQSLALFDKLSMDMLLKIKQFVNTHTANCPTLLTLMCGSCRSSQELKFSLTSIPHILQSALHLDLESIYGSVYQLSTIGIDTVHLSPAERDVYMKMYQQQQINKQQS